MKSVVICQGASSAFLYYQECIRRNLVPVVVNPPTDPMLVADFNMKAKDKILIDMKGEEDYDRVLEEVKKYNPVCVVCGSGGGVHLADRMAKDLGFRGNDPDTTADRDSKEGMQNSLKRAGIRHIVTSVIRSEKDIDTFWDDVKPKKTMMKFSNGAASVGNVICYTREEAKAHFNDMKNKANVFGHMDDVLLQEFIEGDEYIVDTVSCNGQHTLTDIWKYTKVIASGDAVIYDYMTLVAKPAPGISDLVDYAFKVLDAVGIRYGPCHGEFKIDDKGPVLIETNPRPIGLSMSSEYLDEFLDNHITDIALDSYLDPERFQLACQRFYIPKKYAAAKMFISPKECDINLMLMNQLLKNLKSYSSSTVDFGNRTIHSPKTVDLETVPFSIKLCSSKYEDLMNDLDLLRRFEKDYFDLLLDANMTIEASSTKPDIDYYLSRIPTHLNTLVVTDDEEYGVKYGKRYAKGENAPVYDVILFAVCGKSTLAERFMRYNSVERDLIYDGMIVAVPETWEKLPYGSAAVEFIISLAGCRVAIPAGNRMKAIIAFKG